MSSHKLALSQPLQTEASPSQPTIVGKAIIYRQPEVRNVVNKTAAFQSRSGPEVESRIQQNKVLNPQIYFQTSSDPSSNEEKRESQKEKENKNITQPPPLPPIHGNVLIIKDYNPKRKATKVARPAASEEYLISPLTGEKIAASKIQQHMRIGLLDPRWMEQRDKDLNKKSQETVFAPGSAIEDCLKELAERRTDIFGVGDKETSIGKKIGEEDKKKDGNATWDGHMSSVEAATRAARVNITLEDQIHQIHKVKGLLPDKEKEKIGPKPVMQGLELWHMLIPSNPQEMVPRPMITMTPPRVLSPEQLEDEPLSKKSRTEDSLIPEQQFLATNKGPVQVSIAVPLMADRIEWKLNGQMLTIILELSDTVTMIKTRILEQTGMPSGKQKLQYNGMFLKDNKTLAYYNFISGNVINLQQKERGGRKN